MRSRIIVALCACLFVCGRTLAATSAQGEKKSMESLQAAAQQNSSPSAAASTPIADQQNIDELTHRVRKLELEFLQKSQQPSQYRGPIIAAFSAIGVAVLALVGQFLLGLREDR